MKLKLYHAQMEGFITDVDEFIVAQNEEQAKDIIYKDCVGVGYSKDEIKVYEVEVEGYKIQLIKEINK